MSSDAEISNKTLLVLTVVSDFYGDPLQPGGIVGLTRIVINRTEWVAMTDASCLAIRDGEKLIIRREGRLILIERE